MQDNSETQPPAVLALPFAATNDREIPKPEDNENPERSTHFPRSIPPFGLLPAKDRSFRIQAMTGS